MRETVNYRTVLNPRRLSDRVGGSALAGHRLDEAAVPNIGEALVNIVVVSDLVVAIQQSLQDRAPALDPAGTPGP